MGDGAVKQCITKCRLRTIGILFVTIVTILLAAMVYVGYIPNLFELEFLDFLLLNGLIIVIIISCKGDNPKHKECIRLCNIRMIGRIMVTIVIIVIAGLIYMGHDLSDYPNTFLDAVLGAVLMFMFYIGTILSLV